MELLDSRWIFKVKTDQFGKIVCHKARLVARGFAQIEGQDYHEIFAPTIRFESIRMMFKLAAQKNMQVSHQDVTTAYLNAKLDEDIYMLPPEGVKVDKDIVCKLEKCLYGLKQSARAWNAKLSKTLRDMGFKQGQADQCLFVKHEKEHKLYNANSVDTPMVQNFQADGQSKHFENATLYRSILGQLSFIANATRPDISVSVNLLSRQTAKPTEHTWKAMKRIARYLKGTLNYRLKFTKECTGGLEIHVDASFGDDINDRKSTSGVCYMLNHSLFDWSCKKQSTVSLSSCEAELNAFNYAIVNIEWLLQLLMDAEIDVPKPVVYQDNQSSISILKTDSCKQRTKYLQIKLCHAKECIRNGLLQVQYLAGKGIPADLLSKPISKEQHQKLTKYLQLNEVLGYNPKNDRMISIRIQGKPFNITVIQIYAPTTDAEEVEVDQFYEDLQHLLDNTPKRDVIFVTGDWNAKVGSQMTSGITGKHGLGEQNEAGHRLIEFCQDNSLCITNTLFQQPKRWLYTWTSPDGRHRNQIDYILCSQRWRTSIQTVKTRPGADCSSDHELLIAQFRSKLKRTGKTHRSHAICQQIWKTQEWPSDWKKSTYIPIPKKGNTKECSNYRTVALISHASKVMLKILQGRLQQFMERELPDVQAGFRKGRGTRDQIANICWIMEKAREFQKNIYFCFIDYSKAFDCVDHNKLWQVIGGMGIPSHLVCLLRNLYNEQVATVRTDHGTTDWFKIGKGIRQGCILSPYLFNLYAEHIMRRAELDESKAGVKIAGRNINNLRYADDTTLMAESEEELRSLMTKQHQA
ncbi:uncharacterized protein LOC134395383 [Elgaria multicarinata webbii]|uniref:uncharacterized protein LOC134395383 n=1 Tax=Elgaria multicarinata webbii TaxID=159646 RepID=UPI002FCD69CD